MMRYDDDDDKWDEYKMMIIFKWDDYDKWDVYDIWDDYDKWDVYDKWDDYKNMTILSNRGPDQGGGVIST